jgi:colanic acid biosynthesis glycosyl transferase WcaI
MKILIHGINFSPELIGIGKYTGEMAGWLAAQGHAVRVVTAYPYYPQWRVAAPYAGRFWHAETKAGVRIVRCPLWVPRRPGGLARVFHVASFAASSAPVILWHAMTWRPDVVMGIEPTLLAAPAALLAARLSGAVAWLHVQDFEVEAAFATGLIRESRLVRAGLALEADLLRRFDRVSAISPAMCAHARGKGVEAGKVVLMPNWVATDEIHPLRVPSPLRQELGLAPEKVVALYAGNMSEKQGLETLVVAARALTQEKAVQFVFAGEGAARGRLEAMSSGLGNVQFLPLQPPERLNELLNLADIHLLPQRRGVEQLVMPSKLLGMMASGRPVVAGTDPDSALGKVAALCGLVVPPEDGTAMAAGVCALAGDAAARERLGGAGRRHANLNWSRDAVLGQFVQTLRELRAPRNLLTETAGVPFAGSSD